MTDSEWPDQNDQPIVLGSELAEAARVERDHVPPGPSPIAGVRYDEPAAVLWRWVDSPEDDAVSEFVRAYVAADDSTRARMRASLRMDDLYTVLLFARRRALAAMRAGDPHDVVAAFDAVSAIDVERVDWRDVVVAATFAAYAAAHAGIAAESAAAGAMSRADETVSEILSEVVGEDEIDLAEACGYRLVATPDGPALFDDEYETYEPDRDLVPIALGIATAIENESTYSVDALTIASDLPTVWLGDDERVAAAIRNLTGCVSVYAEPAEETGIDPGEHFLVGFLAEAANDQDAALIAAGADHDGPSGSVVIGAAAGRLCVILVASCNVAEQPSFETIDSMARFRPAITEQLQN
jgi:hypothetical protein